jgi:Ni,Fe-hydrogenase I large subunit
MFHSYRLEGEEDLDVLDENGHILYAIQIKNLSKILTLSDLVAQNKTSFLKRFISIYPNSIPVLASFGAVSEEIKKWKDSPNHKDQKEKAHFLKAGLNESQVFTIKSRLEVTEINEDQITDEILDMLKAHEAIDPIPTAENLLYFIPEWGNTFLNALHLQPSTGFTLTP